ncbi:MAG: hypothetical protein WCW77_04065 [Patescibacteria group bacterium]|jgi:hypothetical protein
MDPKKAIVYLSIIAALMIIGADLYFFIDKTRWTNPEAKAPNTMEKAVSPRADSNGIIEKKKNNQALTSKEEEILNAAIEEKIRKRLDEIRVAASGRNYTQEEMDFIYDPSVKIKNELGIR